MAPMQSLKRKRIVLTLEDKLDVIKLKEKGESFDQISRRYNIGATTIKDIMKKRHQIEEAVNRNKSLGLLKTKKTLTEAKRPDVEIKLYDWICEQLDLDEMITNSDILRKAQELSAEVYQEDWKASKGWLSKFKRRYNLTGTRVEQDVGGGEESGGEGGEGKHHEEEEEEEAEHIDDSKYERIEIETIVEEDHAPTETIPGVVEEVRLEMTPLDAAEYLLNYVTANGSFPLKEIITLQMIRDRIAEMES